MGFTLTITTTYSDYPLEAFVIKKIRLFDGSKESDAPPPKWRAFASVSGLAMKTRDRFSTLRPPQGHLPTGPDAYLRSRVFYRTLVAAPFTITNRPPRLGNFLNETQCSSKSGLLLCAHESRRVSEKFL